jgi:hypothetical protein
VLRAILSDVVTPPTVFVPALGFPLDSFFERALAKKPEERFETALDMWEAFRDAIRGVPEDALGLSADEDDAPSAPSGIVGRSGPAPVTAGGARQEEDALPTTVMHTPEARAGAHMLEGSQDSRRRMDELLHVLERSRSPQMSPPAPAAGSPAPAAPRAPARLAVPAGQADRRVTWIAIGIGVAIGIVIALLYTRS